MASAPDSSSEIKKQPTSSISLPPGSIVNPQDLDMPGMPAPRSAMHTGGYASDERGSDIETSDAEYEDDTEIGSFTITSDNLSERKIAIMEKREDARGKLAVLFTVATFGLFFIGTVFAGFTDGNKVDNFKEIMLAISGIFSGLLGFVIGYYFRKGEEEQ